MTVLLNLDAIRKDPQTAALLGEVADAIVELAERLTRVDIQTARSDIEQGVGKGSTRAPQVTIGAKAASAVSVEVGTRYRYASRPIRRAAMAYGLKVPN